MSRLRTRTRPRDAAQVCACVIKSRDWDVARRFASRHGLPQSDVSAILARVDLYDLPPSLYREAGLLPGLTLRSLDALHLAASIRLDVEALVTYDLHLAEAAQQVGLPVHAPGLES